MTVQIKTWFASKRLSDYVDKTWPHAWFFLEAMEEFKTKFPKADLHCAMASPRTVSDWAKETYPRERLSGDSVLEHEELTRRGAWAKPPGLQLEACRAMVIGAWVFIYTPNT